MFGHPVNFRFNKKYHEHKTVIGSICSIFIKAILFIYALILVQRMIGLDDNKNKTVIAKLESISNIGEMKISFNKLMHTKFNLTDLNSSNIDIWLAPLDNWHLEK